MNSQSNWKMTKPRNKYAKELREEKYRQRREEHIKVKKRNAEEKEAREEISRCWKNTKD